MRIRLIAITLGLAGLMLWLLYPGSRSGGPQDAVMASRSAEPQRVQPAELAAAPATRLAEVTEAQAPAGSDSAASAATPHRKTSAGSAPKLRLVHASDKKPLEGVYVWWDDDPEPASTDAQGWCTVPKAPSPESLLHLDVDLDGNSDRSVPCSLTLAAQLIEVTDVMTLVISQGLTDAQTPPVEWISFLERGKPHTPEIERLDLQRKDQKALEALESQQPMVMRGGQSSILLSRTAAARPWRHVPLESLSPLASWDVVAGTAHQTGRTSIQRKAGPQQIRPRLRGSVRLAIDIDAPGLLSPQITLLPVRGQRLNLGSVQRSDVGPAQPRWSQVPEGRYRITISSLSHARWEKELELTPPSADLTATLAPAMSMRVHGSIELPLSHPYAKRTADGPLPIRLIFTRADPLHRRFSAPLMAQQMDVQADRAVVFFDWPSLAKDVWTVSPEHALDHVYTSTPKAITLDEAYAGEPLRFKLSAATESASGTPR